MFVSICDQYNNFYLIEITVNNKLTLNYLKELIKNQTNIPIYNQRLISCGTIIKDDIDEESLKKIILSNEYITLIKLSNIYNVIDTLTGKTYKINLEHFYKNDVKSLKENLKHLYNPKEYDIIIGEKADDEQTLGNIKLYNPVYYIVKKQEKNLKFYVNVIQDNNKSQIEFIINKYNKNKINILKKYIYDKLNTTNYKKQLIIFINDVIIENDQDDYEFCENDFIEIIVIPQKVQYFVKTLKGEVSSVYSSNDSLNVNLLKERLKLLPFEKYSFIFNGNKLNDDDIVKPGYILCVIENK
jgi:hypothetical protein